MLPLRHLGQTDLHAAALGLGAGPLGDPGLSDDEAHALLEHARGLGLALIDTAPSYGRSEARIGRFVRTHGDMIVSTKLGYGVPGVADWTGPAITGGIELALARLGLEALPIAHLHSCPLEVLERGEVVEALLRAVEAGKVQVPAYSGEGEALRWAVRSGAFGIVQASVSCCDPAAGETILREARAQGIGVLAKRPLANAPWRAVAREPGSAEAIYRQRFEALALSAALPPAELMIRWAAHHPAVDLVLVGTTSAAHLEANAEAVARGPLPEALQAEVDAAITRVSGAWSGLI